MSTALAPTPSGVGLDPVLEDMSAWIIAGQVTSIPRDSEYESAYRTPAQGIEDGVDAERLGIRRVFLSERWNFKEAGAFLAGVAARTTRLEVGSGVIPVGTRHPQLSAALGATMTCCFGPRFILGLGLGVQAYFTGMGLRQVTTQAAADYAQIVRSLWRSETVSYDGPAGTFDGMTLGYSFDWPVPEIWYGTFGLPKAAKACAAAFDGVQLSPMLTPEATHAAVTRIRRECELIDRDPSSIRITQAVVTAPDLDDFETRALAHARTVTYLTTPPYSYSMADSNGWDRRQVDRISEHVHTVMADKAVDWGLHRVDLMETAKLVPDAWMEATCAIGSALECVKKLQEWRDAGADEVSLYGSTPAQNAKLISLWRERPEAAR
jgi:5,10-methylenetetrahydromethanopterin reductase